MRLLPDSLGRWKHTIATTRLGQRIPLPATVTARPPGA